MRVQPATADIAGPAQAPGACKRAQPGGRAAGQALTWSLRTTVHRTSLLWRCPRIAPSRADHRRRTRQSRPCRHLSRPPSREARRPPASRLRNGLASGSCCSKASSPPRLRVWLPFINAWQRTAFFSFSFSKRRFNVSEQMLGGPGASAAEADDLAADDESIEGAIPLSAMPAVVGTEGAAATATEGRVAAAKPLCLSEVMRYLNEGKTLPDIQDVDDTPVGLTMGPITVHPCPPKPWTLGAARSKLRACRNGGSDAAGLDEKKHRGRSGACRASAADAFVSSADACLPATHGGLPRGSAPPPVAAAAPATHDSLAWAVLSALDEYILEPSLVSDLLLDCVQCTATYLHGGSKEQSAAQMSSDRQHIIGRLAGNNRLCLLEYIGGGRLPVSGSAVPGQGCPDTGGALARDSAAAPESDFQDVCASILHIAEEQRQLKGKPSFLSPPSSSSAAAAAATSVNSAVAAAVAPNSQQSVTKSSKNKNKRASKLSS